MTEWLCWYDALAVQYNAEATSVGITPPLTTKPAFASKLRVSLHANLIQLFLYLAKKKYNIKNDQNPLWTKS